MKSTLRSQAWFGRQGKDGFIYRAWMKSQGIPDDAFRGKPVIGICNTWSELTPCNAHFRDLAASVKKGILEAGGLPLEFPVMSLGETLIRPTAMLYRNLLSMEVEESIRANPLDGVVLMCGCDKTTPALVMGACSVNIPAIVLSGGSMLTGKYQGRNIGTSDLWRFSENFRSGAMTEGELAIAEAGMCRSIGHCAVMGTASSMACMVESLGLSLPGNAAIPAADTARKVLAQMTGRRVVQMVNEDVKPSDILVKAALENAIRVNAAIGGSTNFVLHLLAIAGRIGVPLTIDEFDHLSAQVPLIANLQPSGSYFMEDLYYAGGLPALMNEMLDYLDGSCMTVNGKSIRDNVKNAVNHNSEVIANVESPFSKQSGLVVLKGNLCEEGAILKPSAASPHLTQHTGRAVAFENIEDYKLRIDDPRLDVDETCILVLKNVGPKGYPGMPEVGNIGLPKKLLEKGITDMIRISDGRMSGTGFGTVVLHVSPEAAAGGVISLVKDGDMIRLDVTGRRLDLLVDEKELSKRRTALIPPINPFERGYRQLFVEHVEQAHLGVDFDFLKGSSGSAIPADSH
ncbi:dihydroxy-acid dehydratase [Chitinophaga pendula]|uniref:IlvD/Edd family dehydratase n=1 Tax=Chitinophaga TaxID=79328 RepID=UPI000BAFBF9C|nr:MULTISPECIES: IlvD/Edd family dehydratase [Chitinophaga]ASZ12101.1 dihydroxy-acid dehydratase [Chitinophaga sp. MD30]UCJ04863.1 dihydroxy-acid dehydratase [Chitinophaga pendula]